MNPGEMGATWDGVVARLKKNEKYAESFGKLYEDGITKANVTDAIAEYETSLVTPSRFDAYLKGDDAAITDAEKKGYATFKEVGCTACHTGIIAGGTMFQKLGLVKDYFKDRGTEITEADLGRFNVTKKDQDKHFFKVPTLRNVELTSPYLHDGSRATLEETVKVMGKNVSVDANGKLYTDIHVNGWVERLVLTAIAKSKGLPVAGRWVKIHDLEGGKPWRHMFENQSILLKPTFFLILLSLRLLKTHR